MGAWTCACACEDMLRIYEVCCMEKEHSINVKEFVDDLTIFHWFGCKNLMNWDRNTRKRKHFCDPFSRSYTKYYTIYLCIYWIHNLYAHILSSFYFLRQHCMFDKTDLHAIIVPLHLAAIKSKYFLFCCDTINVIRKVEFLGKIQRDRRYYYGSQPIHQLHSSTTTKS